MSQLMKKWWTDAVWEHTLLYPEGLHILLILGMPCNWCGRISAWMPLRCFGDPLRAVGISSFTNYWYILGCRVSTCNSGSSKPREISLFIFNENNYRLFSVLRDLTAERARRIVSIVQMSVRCLKCFSLPKRHLSWPLHRLSTCIRNLGSTRIVR